MNGSLPVNEYLHVEIEATNLCNTRCLHCPHEAVSRPAGKMALETYATVLDKVTAYTTNFSIEYAGMGEPLLNPQIYTFIQMVAGRGKTSLTTNASALTSQNIQRLVAAGLNGLTVSFNGSDKALYELMMGGLKFERAQQNLQTALELTRATATQITANVSVTRQTQPRLQEIRRYLNAAGVENIFFSKCHSRGGFLKDGGACTTPLPPVDKYRCDIFQDTIFVAWTGEVLSCCHDLAGANVIGDLKTESLETILERKVQTVAAGVKFSICKDCNDLYRFARDRTPDGQMIAQWVYDLYVETQDFASPSPPPALWEWLNSLYEHEGRPDKFFAKLAAALQEREQQVQAARHEIRVQEVKIQQQANEIHALQAELAAIQATLSYRFMKRIQSLRHLLFPAGSQREQFLTKVLNREQPK